MSDLWLVTYLVLWVLVLFQIFLLWALIRQIGIHSIRLRKVEEAQVALALEPGMRAPDFQVTDVMTKKKASLSAYLGSLTAVVFMASNCSICRQLVEHIGEYVHQFQDGQRLVLIDVEGSPSDLTNSDSRYALLASLDLHGSLISRTHPYPWTMIIDPRGTIQAVSSITTWPDVLHLVKETR